MKFKRVLLICSLVCGVMAMEPDDYLSRLSLDELLNIEIAAASKSTMNVDEAPGIVTVITREEILRYGLETLDDALNLAPGFTTGRSIQSGFHNTLYVRGFHSLFAETVLILWNGQRLNEAITGGAVSIAPDFPLDQVKQIEIIRGPGSALYGANAFAALINIITDETDHEGLDIGLALGGHEAREGALHFGRAFGEWHWSFSADCRHREIAAVASQPFVQYATENPPPFPIGLSLNREFKGLQSADRNEALSFSSALSFGGLTLRARAAREEDANNWGTGVPAGPFTDPFGETFDLNEDRYRHQGKGEAHRFGAFYNHEAHRALSWNAALTYSDVEQQSFYRNVNLQHVAAAMAGEGLELGFLQDRRSNTLNGEWTFDWRPRIGHSLVFGYSFQRDRVDRGDNFTNEGARRDDIVVSTAALRPNGDFLGGGAREVHALYGQYTWEIGDRAAWTGGVRVDDYSDFGRTVNPRLAVVLSASDQVSFKALYGQAFRAPTFMELTNDLDGAVLPNPDLKPEKMRTYEVQANYKPIDGLHASLSVYLLDVDDVIRQTPTLNPDALFEVQARNHGERRGKGLEFELRCQFRQTRLIYLSYSKADAEDAEIIAGETIRNDVGGVPRDSLNLGWIQKLGEGVLLGLTMARRWNWTSEPAVPLQDIEIPGFGLAAVDFLGELTLPDYTLLNLKLTYKNALRGLDLSLDAENILDEAMVYADQHLFAPGGIAVGGRIVKAGLHYRF